MSLNNNISSAIGIGAAVTGAQYLKFSPEVKAAVKNTALGQDVFMKKVAKSAAKIINNLDRAGMEKAASRINVKETLDKAKEMYPSMVKTAKTAWKTLGKTFACFTAGAIIGSVIADKVIGHKFEK